MRAAVMPTQYSGCVFSWGEDWGEAGYMRIRRNVGGSGMCRVASEAYQAVGKWPSAFSGGLLRVSGGILRISGGILRVSGGILRISGGILRVSPCWSGMVVS